MGFEQEIAGDHFNDQDAPAEENPETLVGICNGHRYFAVQFDTVIAVILAYTCALTLPVTGPLVKGMSFYLGYLAYFAVCEAMFSRTFGKWWFGMMVVGADGRRCNWRQAMIRAAFTSIEANPLLLGGLPAALTVFFTKRHQRLGDIIAGTVVNYVR